MYIPLKRVTRCSAAMYGPQIVTQVAPQEPRVEELGRPVRWPGGPAVSEMDNYRPPSSTRKGSQHGPSVPRRISERKRTKSPKEKTKSDESPGPQFSYQPKR